jgi:hypothetical protein
MSTPEERLFGTETDAEVSCLPALELEDEVADERLHIRHGGARLGQGDTRVRIWGLIGGETEEGVRVFR